MGVRVGGGQVSWGAGPGVPFQFGGWEGGSGWGELGEWGHEGLGRWGLGEQARVEVAAELGGVKVDVRGVRVVEPLRRVCDRE